MADVDPRFAASRTLRASVGLTVLAVALLGCGATAEATGNLLGSSAPAGGSGSAPAPTAPPRTGLPSAPWTDRPVHGRPHGLGAPSPCCALPTSPVRPPTPTFTPQPTPTLAPTPAPAPTLTPTVPSGADGGWPARW
ncbi:hypothetical protein [Streptacidiphilus anmyonensis]|uniref:hypothetical protein n=1 Tax=Streptacidiphilus anmyonensis TaxID=405782 RepID=UPI00069465C0|nr:hypothetical protein [Streptacidiphilus anmyonensis]